MNREEVRLELVKLVFPSKGSYGPDEVIWPGQKARGFYPRV